MFPKKTLNLKKLFRGDFGNALSIMCLVSLVNKKHSENMLRATFLHTFSTFYTRVGQKVDSTTLPNR